MPLIHNQNKTKHPNETKHQTESKAIEAALLPVKSLMSSM